MSDFRSFSKRTIADLVSVIDSPEEGCECKHLFSSKLLQEIEEFFKVNGALEVFEKSSDYILLFIKGETPVLITLRSLKHKEAKDIDYSFFSNTEMKNKKTLCACSDKWRVIVESLPNVDVVESFAIMHTSREVKTFHA